MIELAPFHKIGLALSNPIMIAAGCGGYGPPYRHLLDLSSFGAFVTNPITLRPHWGARPRWGTRPRWGPAQPRLVETPTGLILNTGQQNPGVKKVIRRYSKLWQSLGLPVIAHLPADEPGDLHRTARALAGTETLAAFELGLPFDLISPEIEAWVQAIRSACMLPLLLKMPACPTPEIIEAVLEAGVEALVLGSPPLGAARPKDGQDFITGDWYGPALHPLTLALLREVSQSVDIPLIAAGGVHTLSDAQDFLAAGAVAVQLDSLLWLDPGQAQAIAASFRED